MTLADVRTWAHDAGLSPVDVAAAEGLVARMGGKELTWLVLLGLLVLAKRASPAPRPTGPRLTVEQLRTLATSVGFTGEAVDVAAAVAMAESGGDPAAIGDSGTSFGLWQVNLPSHPQYKGAELLDATTNARAAFAISSGGANWQPWTTYRNGAYKRFMPVG